MLTYSHHFKPVFERMFVLLSLPLFIPMSLLIALVIKATSPGPVFYTQHRTGHQGRVFKIYKFRTMHHHLCDDGSKQATHNDARITGVGHFLRKYHLDEIPQLINVIMGNMNIIGPRPHSVPMDHHYAATSPNYWRRYRQIPGITGWAQIHKLHGETKAHAHMMKRVAYDVWYYKKKSFLIDCFIGYHTLRIFLRPR